MADRYLDIGVAGTNSGTLANPWTDWQSAFTNLTAADVIYFKGNATIGTKLTMTGKASTTTPTKFIACDSSWVPTESTYYISGGASITSIMQITSCTNFLWKGIVFKSTTSYLIETGYNLTNQNHVFINCGFESGTTMIGQAGDQIDDWKMINCYFLNLTSTAIDVYWTRLLISHCKFINCGNILLPTAGVGLESDSCLFHASSSAISGVSKIRIINSIFDTFTGECLNLASVQNNSQTVLTNNKFTNCTGRVIDINCYMFSSYYKNNYFYNNSDDIGAGTSAHEETLLDLGGNLLSGVTTTQDYTDRANDDFTPAGEVAQFESFIGNTNDVNSSFESYGWNVEPIAPAMTVTDINPATGASGATITITGTSFTSTGNIVKLGGSGGTSCTITSESTTSIEFTVPAIATGTYDVYVENSDGSNLVVPNGFILTSAVVPVFAGITHFEILSNNKFYIKTGTATESPIYLVYYISTTTNPFAGAYSFKLAYSANKELVIGEESGHFAPLVAGTRYYCGVRAENANGEDVNTAELSNLCSGTAMIQRQTITVLSAK
jgi:hypothetical protein